VTNGANGSTGRFHRCVSGVAGTPRPCGASRYLRPMMSGTAIANAGRREDACQEVGMSTRLAHSHAPLTRRGIGVGALVPFFAFSFGLTWGLGLLAMLFPDAIETRFGEFGERNPLFILAVYAPAITGLALVARHYGVRGLASFLRRVTIWRMPAAAWAGLIVGIPAVYYLGAALSGTWPTEFPFSPWTSALPVLAFALVLGPVEEFGWRGVALPLLQRRLAPLWAGLVLGAIWIVWHLPAFFIGGTPQSQWAFAWFFFGGLALSVLMTALFNATHGSLLAVALFHWQINNPIWPDAMAWASILFILAAIVVVWLRRDAMLSREGAVKDLLYAAEASRTG
jgi:uncharacterized protein